MTRRLLDIAVSAVMRAGRVCARIQGRLAEEGVLQKDDRSPVTVADFASQAIVCGLLHQAGNLEPIVAEEGSKALRLPENARLLDAVVDAVWEEMGSVDGKVNKEKVLSWIDRGGGRPQKEGFWTLDPIDGTKGFLRGDQYAVALAHIDNWLPTLGVLGCPNLEAGQETGAVFAATKELGCRRYSFQMNGEGLKELGESAAIQAPKSIEPSKARFCESVEKAHTDQSLSSQIGKKAGFSSVPFRMDSQCKYAVVATGHASVYLRVPKKKGYMEKIWDHAAGMMVVEGAGGKVTDLDGKPLDFSQGHRLMKNRGVLASSGGVHSLVLDSIQALGA